MKNFTLLLTFLLVFIGVHCQESQKLKTIEKELQRFNESSEKKTFLDVTTYPIILYDKNESIAEISLLRSSPLTIKVYDEKKQAYCFIQSQVGDKTYVYGEYHATLLNNGKIVISLRSTKYRPTPQYANPEDNWELFLVASVDENKLLCREVYNKIDLSDKDYFIESAKLVPTKDAFDVAALIRHKQSGKGKFVVLHYNDNMQLPIVESFDKLETDKNKKIVFDENSEKFCLVANKDKNRTKIYPDVTNQVSKSGYEIIHKESINWTVKAITLNGEHLTFCYGDKLNDTAITCSMFETSLKPIFQMKSIILEQALQKIFVVNLEKTSALIIWVESSGENGYEVNAQIIEGDKEGGKQHVLHTVSHVNSIIYDQVHSNYHCLNIALDDGIKADLLKHCFNVPE